jgi:hypothetical protein
MAGNRDQFQPVLLCGYLDFYKRFWVFFKYVKTRKLLFLITSKPKELEVFNFKNTDKKQPGGFPFFKPIRSSSSKCSYCENHDYTLLEPILWFFLFLRTTNRNLHNHPDNHQGSVPVLGYLIFLNISSFGYLKKKIQNQRTACSRYLKKKIQESKNLRFWLFQKHEQTVGFMQELAKNSQFSEF